jgi:tRNA-2-methylthio-N6-dimethylallyladenosine synthase
MIQQSHIVEIIQTKLTHVDLMFGTHNIHQLLDLLDEVYGSKTRIIDVTSKYGEIIENIPSKRGSHFKAYVNTMFGCDKFCTYCIVPYTRGKERSRLVEDILIECAQLVKEGYQEITLLGQNVNAYGKDLANKTDFSFLLEKVALLGIPRLRFMTSHPWDFTDKMIEVIASHDNIMKTIHLPFQSGNNEILRQMGRRYTKESYRDLVTRMKNKIPNLALTTDIIVGFPGETQSQFEDTLDMVNFVGFDGCFTFIYSPRKGTPASKMTDNVTMEEKHTRFDRLLEIVEIQAVKKADQMVGQVFDVLVDGISKRNENILAGYTRSNKLVHFKGSETLIGKIVNVRIEESHLYSMSGTLINE